MLEIGGRQLLVSLLIVYCVYALRFALYLVCNCLKTTFQNTVIHVTMYSSTRLLDHPIAVFLRMMTAVK